MFNRTLAAGAALLVLAIAACGDDTPGGATDPPPTTIGPGPVGAVATFETPDGGRYRLILEDEHLERARRALQDGEPAGIPSGRVLPGDGGINTGHDWHVVEVELVDMTIELCDATVSYLDDLGYEAFVAQHGNRFCPWAASLVSLE